MRPLPLSLWLLVAAQIDARAFAQAEPQRQPPRLPTAIRKMPPDQGAKFHHSYCAFPDDDVFAQAPRKLFPAVAARSAHEEHDALRLAANSSAELPLRPPFALLLSGGPEEEAEEDEQQQAGRDRGRDGAGWALLPLRRRRAAAARAALASLEKRQWACPSGTGSCAAIGYPNSCCREGERCVEVPDTGLGPVGCCPSGATCGGELSGCGEGSTPCGSEVGGGCCIPGFVCGGVGCVRPAPSPSPSPSPSPTTLTTTSTTTIPGPTPSTVLVTVIVTITPSAAPPLPVTSTVTQTRTAPGGAGAGAPFRPTSSASPTDPALSPSPPSPSDDIGEPNTPSFCPTGFYPCLARAGGGCCQTGRDCHAASCPPPPTPLTTVVDGNGVTVVVPATDLPSADDGTSAGCAQGWFLCGAEAGPVPGCCPSGYSCGTASCSVGMDGGGPAATVAKALPSDSSGVGGRRGSGMGWMGLGVMVAGVGAGWRWLF